VPPRQVVVEQLFADEESMFRRVDGNDARVGDETSLLGDGHGRLLPAIEPGSAVSIEGGSFSLVR